MSYTISTLAERWSCSLDTIRRMIKAKRIKAFRVGNEWRISEKEVERYETEG